MEETEKKRLIEFQLENLLDTLESESKKNNIQQFKWFIDTISLDYQKEPGLYRKCIEDLLSINYLKDDKYKEEARQICEYYYNRARGIIYDETSYINDYRKKHYKQLNVDIPKELMKEFELALKFTNQTKKKFIINCINDFLDKLEK